MEKHQKAGMPVKIANGKLAGKYFVVTDYLVNNFQGKDIAKIAASHPHLVVALKNRGYPVDERIVIGKMYPEMSVQCVHDDELLVQMSVVEGGGEKVELPPNVEAMSKKRKPKIAKERITEAGKKEANKPLKAKEDVDGPESAG